MFDLLSFPTYTLKSTHPLSKLITTNRCCLIKQIVLFLFYSQVDSGLSKHLTDSKVTETH